MDERIVIGYVEYAVNVGLFITLDDNTRQELYFEDIYQVLEMPLNRKLAVLVDEDWNLSKAEKFFQEIEAPALINTTDKRIAVAYRRGGNHEAANQMAQNAANFWAQMSEGYWTVTGFGYALPEEYADCYPHFSVYCNTEMRNTFRDLPDEQKPDWYPNYWHIVGSNKEGACGTATLGGNRGVTYLNCGNTTLFHELGHNFGLMHSNTEDENGVKDEYHDRTSVMGSHAAAGLHPPHAYALGFYQDNEVRHINKNSQFVICPWEMHKTMRADNEKPFNIIEVEPPPRAQEKYFVSVRKQRGNPNSSGEEGVVYIHRANKASWLLDEIKPGEESTRIPGVTVKHLENKNEVALVEVIYDNDNSIPKPDTIKDERFPEPLAHVEVSEQHDGLWYNPKMNGQGFDIHIKNGRINIYWYTYVDTKVGLQGSKRWFVAECDLTNGPEVFDIFTVEDAEFTDPSAGSVYYIGKGQFYCFDENTGVFNYLTEEHGRGSIPLVKLATSNSPEDGAWYNPSREYEGFTFRFMENGERCVGFWYTHSTSNNNPHIPVPASRIWYSLEGRRQEDGSYLLDCMNTKSYEFLEYNLFDVEYDVIGQVTLTPKGDKFVFESNINNRELTSELQKIF